MKNYNVLFTNKKVKGYVSTYSVKRKIKYFAPSAFPKEVIPIYNI